jgi:glycosyltransferase involved in cell wall biosynthesis
MKILFVSYPHVGLGKGGMYFQIKNTRHALEELGHEVHYHNFMDDDLTGFDACHFFALDSINQELVLKCSAANVPVYFSPVYNVFAKTKSRQLIERKLANLIPGFLSHIKILNNISNLIQYVFPLNEEEKIRLELVFPSFSGKTSILPNGIDTEMTKENLSSKKSPNMVLNVGEICQRKNQLNLIKAAENSNWELHLVGGFLDDSYSKSCVSLADKLPNVFIHGALEYGSETLLNLYRKSKVFALPSHSEVQPLTILEAAQFDCNVVAGATVPIQDFFKGYVSLCDANNIHDIRSAVDSSLEKEAGLKNIVEKQPSWIDIADKLVSFYRSAKN